VQDVHGHYGRSALGIAVQQTHNRQTETVMNNRFCKTKRATRQIRLAFACGAVVLAGACAPEVRYVHVPGPTRYVPTPVAMAPEEMRFGRYTVRPPEPAKHGKVAGVMAQYAFGYRAGRETNGTIYNVMWGCYANGDKRLLVSQEGHTSGPTDKLANVSVAFDGRTYNTYGYKSATSIWMDAPSLGLVFKHIRQGYEVMGIAAASEHDDYPIIGAGIDLTGLREALNSMSIQCR
jgi:hypothetical protein